MKSDKGIQGWIRGLTEHTVQKKRDERRFLDETNTCPSCHRHLSTQELEATMYTCPHCQHHFRLTAWERIRYTADEGVFQELSSEMETANPLEFPDYEQKLAAAAKKTGIKEAVVTGLCRVSGQEVVLGVMDFRFIGGSMGAVVGEKIMRAMLVAAEKKLPAIVFTSSGGARMQEGILSLMQMAKTAVATQALEKAKCPYFVVLTDPTTAGVLASFAMLGDVTLAEPGALMRFAGARVVAGTIREKVPENFPLSQYHYERGFIDRVVPRQELKATLGFLLKTHAAAQGGKA
ncbi:MAG: acetyl-CoA carboxylase carboxyltransferase subunit beta [Spirochaetia bacterium]